MDSPAYRCGDFHVDAANRKFTCRGTPIPLEPKSLAVILQLLARPGALVTRNELLDAVWGHRYVTPSTLSRVIALARRAFNDDIDEPRYIQTVHGAGYRYVGPLQREEPVRADADLRFGPPPSARLPARVDSLIGRERELDELAQALLAHRAVTILGTGGMGKTQCALEWARQHAGDFADGVWFFDLAPLRSGSEWLSALATSLAIPAAGPAQLLPRILPLLKQRRALLLLDNCDRCAAEVGALAVELLRGTDALKLLATSQAPLNFVGEHVMRMPPLALPRAAGDSPTLEEVAAAAAVRMLLARISAVQPGFALHESNAASIAEICQRLDGMPLALELAAARFALLSPEQVLQRLTQRFRFLGSSMAGRDDRHRSLLVLLEWSFSLLSPEEQRLLCWCSVFVRGWTMEAAIDLAAPQRCDPETIVELLTGLVSKSLVSVDPSLDPPRYHLLETVREFALERLRQAGEERQARDAHLAFVVHMTRGAHADMLGDRMARRVAQLIHEDGNIERALDYGLEAEAGHRAALAILGNLTLYLKARGVFHAARRWCQRVLAATPLRQDPERARALLCAGVMAVHLMESREAAELQLREALRLARQHGDAWTEAYASGYCAIWLANGGRAAEALQFIECTQHLAAQLGDALLLGLAGLARGWAHIAQGDCEAAIQAMSAVRELGEDPHQRHFIDMYLGLSHFRLGQYPAAARRWAEAVRGAAAVSNIRGLAGSVEGCGYIAARLGQACDAARMLAAAAKVRERTAVPLFSFWRPHHEAAAQQLRAALGASEYALCTSAGAGMRQEDAINEGPMPCSEISAGATPPAREASLRRALARHPLRLPAERHRAQAAQDRQRQDVAQQMRERVPRCL